MEGREVRRVIVESPYGAASAEAIRRNIEYARACVRDCLERGESPIASHLLYTQPGVLRDEIPEERTWGMEAGWAWMQVADAVVVYIDYGISRGMQQGIEAADKANIPVEMRELNKDALYRTA